MRPAGGSHRATLTPKSPTRDEIKLGANNRGEAPGKAPATLVAFLSKQTYLRRSSAPFWCRNALSAATLPSHHDCQDPNRQCPVGCRTVPWFSQSSAGWHRLLAVG